MVVAAVVLLLVGLSTGVIARRDVRARPPLVAHVPGQPTWVRPTPPFRLRVWAVLAAVTVIGVIAGLVVEPVAGLVVAIIGTSLLALTATILHRYATGCEEVRQSVDEYAPAVAVPYAGKVGVHIGMWSPWIERTGVKWCIVAATPPQFRQLADMYPAVPIVQGRIPTSVRVALYPHGATGNTAFMAESDATHVFLGHGDSDKPLSASSRVLDYDLVAVAGQGALDRFAQAGVDVPADRVRVIGRPQTEGIRRASGPVPPRPTVLYAPTWRHADDALDISSLRVADRLVDALIDRGCTVIFRRHFAGSNHAEAEAMISRVNERLATHAATTGRAHRWGADAMDAELISLFNASDAMVADVSGIVVDFLASEKPLLMYAAQFDDVAAFRAQHPTAEAAYVLTRGLPDVDTQLEAALGPDPLAPTRSKLAAHYLGGTDRAEPAARFMTLVDELAHRTV